MCVLHGTILPLIVPVCNLLTTFFNYHKIIFYKNHFDLSENSRKYFKIARTGMLLWLMVILPVNLVVIEPGPTAHESTFWCSKVSTSLSILIKCSMVIYFVLNCIIIYLIFTFRSATSNIPHIQNQIRLNNMVVPWIFMTSVLLQVLIQFIRSYVDSGVTGIFWALLLFTFDQILNNAAMFIAIYARFEDENEASHCESVQLDISDLVVDGQEQRRLPAYKRRSNFYLDIPGGHPILVARQVIEENRLWHLAITDPKTLHNIRKYARYGFVPSLRCCCKTLADLEECIELHE